MIKSKKLQKFIGLFVAVAVLASMTVASLTLGSASSDEVVFSLIDEATTDTTVSWRDFGTAGGLRGDYTQLSNLTEFNASFTADKITYTNFKGTDSALFGWAGRTFFTVEEGYTLNFNLNYHTPGNAAWSWKVELYNGTSYVDISEAVAKSAGISYGQWGMGAQATDVVGTVDLAEAMGVGTSVAYIRIFLAFGSQSDETSFTINDFTVTKPAEEVSSSSSGTEEPSEAKWSLIDDATTDTNVSWRDFGNNLRGNYTELSNLTKFNASFTTDKITYTNFTSASSAMFGWAGKTFFTVEEGDVLNLNLNYHTPNNAAWSWKVSLYNKATSAYVDISEAIAKSAGISYSQYGMGAQATDVVASVDLAEVMGVGTEVNYIQIYLAFASQSDETSFTVNDFSITKASEDTPSETTGEVRWTAPLTDASQWLATPWPGNPLDSDACKPYITYEIGDDGSLTLGFPEGATVAYPYAKIQDANGLLELTEDDVLNLDFSWHQGTGETAGAVPANQNFKVELLFGEISGTSGVNAQYAIQIGQAITDAAASSGAIFDGDYDVSINLKEAVQKCATAEQYEAIFGASGDSTLKGIRFTINSNGNPVDTTAYAVIRECNITDGMPPQTLYAAGMNSLTDWLTYDTANTANAYLAPIGDGSDPAYTGHMKGEVLSDGIKFTFTDEFYGAKEAGNGYGSFVRQFKAAPGLCTVDNTSYLNLRFKLEEDTELYGAQLYLRVGPSGDQNVTPVIAKTLGVDMITVSGIGANGVDVVSYETLPAGEYTISMKVSDLLADYPDQAALLADGAPFVFHQLFVRADDDCATGDDVALTVYEVSVTDAKMYENAYDDLAEEVSSSSSTPSSSTPSSSTPSSSTPSSSSETQVSSSETQVSSSETQTSSSDTQTSSVTSASSSASTTTSATSTTSSPSSVAQVQTGEAMIPVIAVAALAVVSASAVVISKKRSK